MTKAICPRLRIPLKSPVYSKSLHYTYLPLMNYPCGEILGLQAPKLDTFCAIIRMFYDLHNADIDFARGKPINFKAKFY